jgi:purine nucleosidase
MQEKRQKFIIDTDPGIDDMMAILYLVQQPSIEIVMISLVDGNVSLDHVTTNSKKVVKMSDKILPLYSGSSYPIIKTIPNIESYHCCDGLGDIEEIKKYDADDIRIEKQSSIIKLVETITLHKNDINLICLGPLTNIAAAFMLEPRLPEMINSIYVMGGSYLTLGNTTASAEFNFSFDFVAANIVLSNFKNLIITPWEPTIHASLSVKSETMVNVNKNFISKKLKLHEIRYNFVNLIVMKYTKERGDTCFCDLYAVIPLVNKKSVKKFGLYKFDIIIDSFDFRGTSIVKEKKTIDIDFETFYNTEYERYKDKGYHLVIEEFYEKVVFDELEHIFIHH